MMNLVYFHVKPPPVLVPTRLYHDPVDKDEENKKEGRRRSWTLYTLLHQVNEVFPITILATPYLVLIPRPIVKDFLVFLV